MDEQALNARLIDETLHLVPDLDQLIAQLAEQPQMVVDRAFPDRGFTAPPSRSVPPVDRDLGDPADPAPEQLLQDACETLLLIRRDGRQARLEPRHRVSIEAVIKPAERPTFLLNMGLFTVPEGPWRVLDDFKANIAETARRVGRIQVRKNGQIRAEGTGFLVADDVIMTNRHVAERFSAPGADSVWSLMDAREPCIDYADDPDALSGQPLPIRRVIGIHPDPNIDLALLQLSAAPVDRAGVIGPLIFASAAPPQERGRPVYVVGYPLNDPFHDPLVLRMVFGGRFGLKRLQPGEILAVFEPSKLFNHDCSTLGGNSGSCVVDLATNRVLGLHFSGLQGEWNQAIALWTLRDDPLLRSVGVQFA